MSLNPRSCAASSMTGRRDHPARRRGRLNPRSCAASSMTPRFKGDCRRRVASQSAFVRGFIDDRSRDRDVRRRRGVSIRVRARLHR